ncbi:putative endonuclease 8 2 [Corynebacterium deserti GIMN1.010]|uniref:DNA-(apurinic or apyrimidinic site) lyase n=1 Tax=Corynebacterium deserti GIMN1.010 TaxID=931089 RepID=A0A0M3Q9A4_9CORY|nr:DNA-formamidopyrimidine glycosylase family protein [Corynebacterium deserti]ALC05299.1 putative endonuclease 8 2 [Corynebacterium deserti GIMN1.010]
MPEGDSVFQLSRRLQFMRGREVLETSLRVPSVALHDFTGRTVHRVWPYGKHLFMQFGDDILHTHLKMEGTWAVHRKGDRWRKPAHTARVVLVLSENIEVVGFSLGFVKVYPASQYPEAIANLGPDVLAQHFDMELAKKNILKEPSTSIGVALLDQSNLAGVGNEYRAEICFLLGVHPATPVAHVDVDKALRITRRLMWENRNSPIRVTTGVRRAGESTYVFGRNNKPCRRCRSRILKAELGERIIWWCPHCQPLDF